MGHHYKKDGIKYPSVTTIISDCTDSSGALTQWAANQCKEWIIENCVEDYNWVSEEKFYEIYPHQLDEMRFNFRKVSQKALDIGSEVHNAIEMHLQDKDYTLTTKEAENAFEAFLKWKDEHNLKPIALEQTVWGDRFAGTLDFFGYFDGKLYVIDWKSSKNHYPEMRYQVACYRSRAKFEMLRHEGKVVYYEPPVGCGILRLDKETGLPDWKDTTKTYESDLNVFNKMIELYFARHPRIRKRFEEE